MIKKSGYVAKKYGDNRFRPRHAALVQTVQEWRTFECKCFCTDTSVVSLSQEENKLFSKHAGRCSCSGVRAFYQSFTFVLSELRLNVWLCFLKVAALFCVFSCLFLSFWAGVDVKLESNLDHVSVFWSVREKEVTLIRSLFLILLKLFYLQLNLRLFTESETEVSLSWLFYLTV